MLYFLSTPTPIGINQKLTILSLVFVVTYLIPLLMLLLFKKLKIIKSYELSSIKERKLPIAIIIVLFYVLGNTLDNIVNLQDLGILFYATSLGLFSFYILFFFGIKASIHLLSLGVSAAFFMVLAPIHSHPYVSIVAVIFLLAGLLGSARLHLHAHTSKEVYLGFFIGILAVFSVYLML